MSQEEVEVLDLTTLLSASPGSNPQRSSSSALLTPNVREISLPGISDTVFGSRSQEVPVQQSESDDDFAVSESIPLRERLKRGRTATQERLSPAQAALAAVAERAARSPGSNDLERLQSAQGDTHDGSSPSASRVVAEGSRKASIQHCLDEDSDFNHDHAAAAGKFKSFFEDQHTGLSGAGAAATASGDDSAAVIDLLSDSDDGGGGAVAGRSLLWKGGKSCALSHETHAEVQKTCDVDVRFRVTGAGDEDYDTSGHRHGADIETSLGIDDFEALALYSQNSDKVSSITAETDLAGDDGRRFQAEDSRTASGRHTIEDTLAYDSDDDFSLAGVSADSIAQNASNRVDSSTEASQSEDVGRGLVERHETHRSKVGTTVSREEKMMAKKEAAASKKRQRVEAAAAVKQQREREREEKKSEKERQRREKKDREQAETVAKAAQREIEKQARGKFSHREIACVMERRYYESARSAGARAGAGRQSNGTEEFLVTCGESKVAGAVWWTRRAHLEGGAAATGPGVQTLDILVVVVEPASFLDKLRPRIVSDGDFPELGSFVDEIRRSTRGHSRVIFILEGAERELNRLCTEGVSIMDLFEDSQCWLLIHKDVETRLTNDGDETGQYLWDLTRALSVIPYKDDITELHCVPRFKTRAHGSEELSKEDQDLADTWVRMLQQVPGISEAKALEIALHYKLPRDLVRALSDPRAPESERVALLADKMGTGRTERVYARRLYDLFTQEDGDFVLT